MWIVPQAAHCLLYNELMLRQAKQWPWSDLTHSGISPANVVLYGQAFIVTNYSLLAALALVSFGILHFVAEHNPLLGMLELGSATCIILNIFILRTSHNISFARAGFLLIVIGSLLAMLMTGGTQNTGIFWYFVFPVCAFFLTNKKQGVWWVGALLVASIGLALLAQFSLLDLPYTFIEIRQLLTTLLVVAIGIYVYQQSRETLAAQTAKSNRALQEEKIRAETILESIDEGIVTTDAEGNILALNKAAETMLKQKTSGVAGKLLVEAMPLIDKAGNTVEQQDHPVRQAFLHHATVAFTGSYKRKDGSSFPAAIAGRLIVIDGKIQGAIMTIRDITEQQAVERGKNEFIALASHQLRTPISSIAWVSEILLSGDAGALPAEQRTYIQQIYDSNRRSAAMVDAILTVSSLELGGIDVTPEPIDLCELADKLLDDQATLLGSDKKIHIAKHYDHTLSKIKLDMQLTRTLLRNVFSNAFKYTVNGGEISVSITQSTKKLSPHSRGSAAVVVSDTGYGIPEKQKAKIFEKLFRASNVKIKDTDGTGLGLYIVKKILDRMGGQINFVSQEGKGSTFTILLPLEGTNSARVQGASHV